MPIEKLRAMARRLLTPQSSIFRVASHVYNDFEITRREGFAMRATLQRLTHDLSGAQEVLRLSKLAHPITVRAGTDDIQTILNNVIREEYAHALPAGWKPRVMIDAGAFIGDTSAYFLSRYPTLTVIALEPERANLELARVNLAAYGDRVELVPAALAGAEGTVRFSGASVSGSVQASGIAVPATTVARVMAERGLARVDLLKMDIEGAELEVVSGDLSGWLPRVDMVIAELHGAAITATVTGIMGDHGFKAIHYRSLTFFRRPGGARFI
jgi:FkbM family methyltransferase